MWANLPKSACFDESTRDAFEERNREASFSVDVPCDVAVQPFLLIVRTRHVVTIVNAPVGRRRLVVRDTRSFQQIAGFIDSKVFTVSRRSEPSSRTALMGEQPNPWDLLQPQDATSRHRGAKPFRRCGLLGRISLLSPAYLLSVERRQFHSPPSDH